MLRIKEEWIVKANKANVAFNIPRRKYNQPKRLGSPVCGRIPEGEAKYKSRYIQKMAVVVYKDGSERVELVCIRWQIISLYVRDRDGRCLKCGSTEELTGDHFYPLLYLAVPSFPPLPMPFSSCAIGSYLISGLPPNLFMCFSIGCTPLTDLLPYPILFVLCVISFFFPR